MPGKDPLTDEEIDKVYLELKSGTHGLRNSLIFMLGVMTGFRTSEILSIKLHQICVNMTKVRDHLELKPSQMKGGNKGKKDKSEMTEEEKKKEKKLEDKRQNVEPRKVLIPEQLKGAISEYIEWYRSEFAPCERTANRPIRKDDYLFRSQKALKENQMMHYATVCRMIKAAAAKNGIDEKNVGGHSMRKTYAHKMYEINDKDINKTQKMMGHKLITSTQHYLSSINQQEKDQITSKFAQPFTGAFGAPNEEPDFIEIPTKQTKMQ